MGIFIAIEGGEYTGKTTVVLPGIAAVLKQSGFPVLVSREPGGSSEAEKLRQEIFRKKRQGASVYELTELFFQARQIHLQNTIIPFLGMQKEKDGIVLLDRYTDSTRMYQGCEEGLPISTIHQLEKQYIHDYLPDITFLLTIPETQFEQYITVRRQLSYAERGDDDTTAWDEENTDKHRKRQHCLLQLPDIAKKNNEHRLFETLDTSLHPHDIVTYAVQRIMQFISKQEAHIDYLDYIPLVSMALQRFPSSPLGKELDERWEKQEELRKIE